jgi:hypothetical protein
MLTLRSFELKNKTIRPKGRLSGRLCLAGLCFSVLFQLTVRAQPTVALTAPAGGAVFAMPVNITLAANATSQGGTIAHVDFYQGFTLLGTVSTPPYVFTWTNVPTGYYSVRAKATDNLGTVTASAPASVTVKTFMDGLVAYYPLNGDFHDASGYGNDGLLIGNDWVYSLDRFGQRNALYLNTTSNPTSNSLGTYVTAARNPLLDLSQDFTWSVWLYIPNGLGPYHVHNLISDGIDQTSANFRLISNVDTNADTGGHDYLQIVGDYTGDIHAFLPQVRNTWWQAVIVRSGTNVSLFQNGILVSSGSWTVPIENNPEIWIGGMLVAGYPLVGGIDEIRMFNRAFSAQQILQLYQYDQHRLPYLTANPNGLNLFVAQGSTNQIECSTDLTTWGSYGEPVPATSWIIHQDVNPSGPQRFFRVKVAQ